MASENKRKFLLNLPEVRVQHYEIPSIIWDSYKSSIQDIPARLGFAFLYSGWSEPSMTSKIERFHAHQHESAFCVLCFPKFPFFNVATQQNRREKLTSWSRSSRPESGGASWLVIRVSEDESNDAISLETCPLFSCTGTFTQKRMISGRLGIGL